MLGQPIYMLLPEVVGLELTGQLAARRDGDRPGAHGDAKSSARRGWSASSSSSSGRACRRCRWPTGRRSATWRPSTARRWASSRSTTRRSTTSARPAAPRTKSSWSSGTRRSRACSAPTTRHRAEVHARSLRLDLSTVEPSLAGPKRPQDRVPLANMKPAWMQALTKFTASVRREGSPEGRWEGEGGHKIDPPPPIRAAHRRDPGFDGVASTGTARSSTSSTATW